VCQKRLAAGGFDAKEAVFFGVTDIFGFVPFLFTGMAGILIFRFRLSC